MLTLDAYLSDGIHRDREDIAAIERILAETGETIVQKFDDKTKDWPYEIRRKDPDESREFSQSTTAMMIHAIDLLREAVPRGPCEPYPFKLGALSERLGEQRKAAFKALVARIAPSEKDGSESEAPCPSTWSGTYGTDDPLTLSFLAEILPVRDSGSDNQVWRYAKKRAKDLLHRDPEKDISGFFDFSSPGPEGKPPQKSTPLTNAFIPLRVVRACRLLDVRDTEDEKNEANYLRYFESTLHDQLSYSAIPDSRFDPAELIFCLEGLLRLPEQSVDTRLFDRVLDVLEAAQNTSAHWRPNKPFLRSERGLVLFPISVEAANSLRWSCAALDKDERFHPYSERYIALFRRFWEWLAARRVTFGSGKSGWHSDHVADPDSIQLWDTAQVVGFLLGYRRSLYNHIARTTLRISRFNVRKPERARQSWSDATRDKQQTRKTVIAEAANDKASLRKDFEPVTSLGNYFATYRKVEEEFLIPWLEGISPRNYSMLLYGPPGTGKTSVAENLADALCFRLITITVSDFLAGGGGEVEARAKMIFDVLEAQANVVILFDEIDELVLDRSSKRHREQDTVFKFMTPGMLTKLNNLRRAERSIFIMATNYAYRIDPAIRRTGRIDENYLLLPPDAASRRRMLTDFLRKAIEKGNLQSGGALDPDTIERNSQWEKLQDASFFLSYKDMEAAVARVERKTATKQTVPELERELLDWGRTTTLRLYNGAFDETEDRDAIEREFLPLVEMAAREGKALERSPALDTRTLFDEKDGRKPTFANEEKLKKLALEFVKRSSPEYDPK